MKTPRKHAALIKLWADGAEIQWEYARGHWGDCVENPLWNEEVNFRVKPIFIRYRSALVKTVSGKTYFVHTVTDGLDDQTDMLKWPGFVRWLGDWHEVEEAAPRNKYPDLSTEGEN